MTKTDLQPLTKHELTVLGECETIIERGQRTFVEVGQALLKIRNGRLYKAHFENFGDYCQQRWGFKKARASQLISAADVQKFTNVNIPNEAAARQLAKVGEEKLQEVAQAATELAQERQQPMTAAIVAEVAEQISPSNGHSKEDPFDPWPEGIKATKPQKEEFLALDEDLQEALTESILAGRQTLTNALETKEAVPPTIEEQIVAESKRIEASCRAIKKVVDEEMGTLEGPWFDDLNKKDGAQAKFDAALEIIRSCKPSKPCPKCEGTGCVHCKRTGMVPRSTYSQLT